uniref:E3 SUMO-protein ligase RanBP2 n=1 Tax=Parascaris univalens TaxID=6257 RepID=A0A914ZWU4_PARUN
QAPQAGFTGSPFLYSIGGADASFASSNKSGLTTAMPPQANVFSSPQVAAMQKVITASPIQPQQHVFGIAANRMPASQTPLVDAAPSIPAAVPPPPPPSLSSGFVSESKVESKPVNVVGSTVEFSAPKCEAATTFGSTPKQEPPKGTTGTTTFSFSNVLSSAVQSGHAQPSVATTTAPSTNKFAGVGGGFTFGMSATKTAAFTAPKDSASPAKSDRTGKEGEEEDVPELFEPSAHFEPVIPLPDLVEVTTGEENEKVVFAERCKLYRFSSDTSEWKERGIGVLKILHDPNTASYRIVMRRDQIYKVCANHKIQAAMILTPMQKSDRAFVWLAQDFAEGEMVEEKLAARFKTIDLAKKFADTFNMARNTSATNSPIKSKGPAVTTMKQEMKTDKTVTPPKVEDIPKGFGDAFKPAAGSWECKSCYVRNNADVSVCPCCNTSKNGTPPSTNPQSTSIFTSKPMSTVAPLKGDAGRFSFGLGPTSTTAAVTPSPPVGVVTTSQPAPAVSLDKTPAAPTFGIPLMVKSSEASKTTPASTVVNVSTTTTIAQPKFNLIDKFKSNVPAVSSAPNFSLFATLSEAKSTDSAPIAVPKATFSLTATQASKAPVVAAAAAANAAPASTQPSHLPSFSFKLPTLTEAAKSSPTQMTSSVRSTVFGGPAVFGAKPIVTNENKGISGEKPKTTTFGSTSGTALFGTSGSIFGGTLSEIGSGGFAALAAMAKREPSSQEKSEKTTASVITPFGDGKFDTSGDSVFSSFSTKKSNEATNGSREKTPSKAERSDGEEEFVPTAHFEPVIPTPPLIKVKTGEEDEKVLFKARAKLFRFVDSAKEYKERGVGDIKILLNEANGKCRIVMRREQVFKVCANAPLIGGMTISKKPGTENVCIWMCKDYAEVAAGTNECFAVKFKEVAFADEFMSIFRDACGGKYAKDVSGAAQSVAKKGEGKSSPAATSEPSQITKSAEKTSCEDDGTGPMGTVGDSVTEEDYDEDPYEELADFAAKMTVTENFASPLKPAKSFEVKGSYSIGIQHDVGAMKVDLLDEEGVVQLTHFIVADTIAAGVEPKSMRYTAVDEKSKNKLIEVEFEEVQDRNDALKHIAEGVKLAIQVREEDDED